MHAIASFFVGIAAFFGGLLGMQSVPVFGTTVTTINGSDTLSASRTTLNNNFTALLNGKIENSTTSVSSITTLPNLTSVPALTTASLLATIGTITSGTWNGTTIGVPYGGTGSTTLSSHQILLGSGGSNISVVTGLGTSGQTLTSNGAGASPTWQSSAGVDQSASYTWTGTHAFRAGVTMSSTSIGTLTAGIITATTTTGTSTLSGNLQIVGNATTTNLTISGTCTGCSNGYAQNTNTGAGPTTGGAIASVTATCSGSKQVIGGGGADSNNQINVALFQSYPSATNAWTATYVAFSNATANTITAYAICVNP